MKTKLLLLATAALFASPVAAKANQKGSVYLGVTGTMQQFTKSEGADAAFDKTFKDETFWAAGIEAGYGYKVWNNLQLAGFVRGSYALAHEFDAAKKLAKQGAAFEIEPRVTIGWEIPMGSKASITPFVGAGVEFSFAKKAEDSKEYNTDWTVPGVLGARVNFGYVYTTISGRFDLTAKEHEQEKDKFKARSWGGALTVGAEF
jgi:hypothetical protein